MTETVPNIASNVVNFKARYKEIVHNLVPIRKASNQSMNDMAKWLKVDARKIQSFEGLKKIDLELMLVYGDKLSVEINLEFKVY